MLLLDTNFLIDLEEETADRRHGPARTFLASHHSEPFAVSVISLGELAAGMEDNQQARLFLSRFRVMSLKPEIALEGAAIDRELMRSGGRLGENDTWIAGMARYYGISLVSNDRAFERVTGIHRRPY